MIKNTNFKKKKVRLKNSKRGSQIFDENGKKIKFTLRNVYLKFGFENYNGNKILNILVNKDPNKKGDEGNEEYNKLASIYNYVKSVENTGKDFIEAKRNNIEGKGFMTPLEDTNEYGHCFTKIRTYMSYSADIMMKGGFAPLEPATDITGYMADVDVEIKTMWKTNNNYGVTIYTTNVELIKRIKSKKESE
jgi:hypothetical protein